MIGNKMTTVNTPEVQTKVRNKRKPFGIKVSRLAISKQQEGFHYRWVNDEPGRLSQAIDGGYDFVVPSEVGREPREDNKTREYAGLKADGGPMFTYLMKIPQEYYEEDQESAQEHLDSIDKAIRGGSLDRTPSDNRYIPKEGIKFKT